MGRLVTFDGIDASGKTTQAKILEKNLCAEGKKTLYLSFPVYESEGSAPVRLYLGGGLGKEPEQTNAYAASSFFAVDRYISYVTDWRAFLEEPGSIVITNRYTTANAIHQLSKLPRDEWDEFLDWLCDYEFEKLQIPKPDLTVFFDMDPGVALSLLEERAKKTGEKKDIHESSPEFLKKSYEAGTYAASRLGWERLACCHRDSSGALVAKSEREVSAELFDLVRKHGI